MVEPLKFDDLVSVFVEAETSPAAYRIGAESEKFGVHEESGAALCYQGNFSVCEVVRFLCAEHGWSEVREVEGGPVLGARRGGASVTLEPGAQFELSGDALDDLHQVCAEAKQHLEEIAPISQRLKIAWLATGFHPLARLDELPWVPKMRYPIMKRYLPEQGSGGLDMMQRTCTTQGNFDWSDERDGLRKLRLALKLSPLMQAWFSNAPFREKEAGRLLSHRGVVWQNMDPSRSGLIRALMGSEPLSYESYVHWSLEAGMFLFKRNGKIIENTGQSFADFMAHGFRGEQACLDDYRLHLTTLFPEVRLKNTLEVRSVDALPPALALSSLALWTGLLYDQAALDAAEQVVLPWTYEELEAARPAMCQRALDVEYCGRSAYAWAEQVLEIADRGLENRARVNNEGQSEAVYLQPAREILESRCVPAERALERYRATGSFIEASRIDLP